MQGILGTIPPEDTEERDLPGHLLCWRPDLELPASRTVRKLIYTVQGSQLVISVLAALEDG